MGWRTGGEGVVDHCASVAHKKVSCQGFICVDLSPSACALVCFRIVRALEGGDGRADWRSQEKGVRRGRHHFWLTNAVCSRIKVIAKHSLVYAITDCDQKQCAYAPLISRTAGFVTSLTKLWTKLARMCVRVFNVRPQAKIRLCIRVNATHTHTPSAMWNYQTSRLISESN